MAIVTNRYLVYCHLKRLCRHADNCKHRPILQRFIGCNNSELGRAAASSNFNSGSHVDFWVLLQKDGVTTGL